MLDHLRGAGVFAFDTEFISEMSYHPRLCLVQVATPERLALIDPIAGLDVTPFWELVADPGVLKLVHAGQQDLEPVPRLLGSARPTSSTPSWPAGLIGLPWPLALNKLVAELLGAEISKGPAFTDWSRRPLDEVQVFYAANDVRFLPAMHAVMAQRLAALGRAGLAGPNVTPCVREDLHRTVGRRHHPAGARRGQPEARPVCDGETHGAAAGVPGPRGGPARPLPPARRGPAGPGQAAGLHLGDLVAGSIVSRNMARDLGEPWSRR
jgi:ribonuclease D